MKIEDYEIVKEKVTQYKEQMEVAYNETKKLIDLYNNSLSYKAELANFNYKESIRFIRLWDIIQSDIINQAQRNLLFCYSTCNNNLEDTLACFNGKGKGYKNKASLSVLLCNIRKIITKEYSRLYGSI